MIHPYANKLIYAADITFPKGITPLDMLEEAQRELDTACKAFQGLGITIKGNTLFRTLGVLGLAQLASAGCKAFVDLKLFDVQSTCANDASMLQNCNNIEILTVNIDVNPKVFGALFEMLPNTIIAPVKPLTDLTDEDFKNRGETDRQTAVQGFFLRCMDITCNGAICSPKDLELAPLDFKDKHQIITPGIRPAWATISGDTNAVNALTHQDAIRAGADRLVIGSPIRFQGKMGENALRILDEIGEEIEKMQKSV